MLVQKKKIGKPETDLQAFHHCNCSDRTSSSFNIFKERVIKSFGIYIDIRSLGIITLFITFENLSILMSTVIEIVLFQIFWSPDEEITRLNIFLESTLIADHQQ